MKITAVRAELFYAHRRTDRHVAAFRNFAGKKGSKMTVMLFATASK